MTTPFEVYGHSFEQGDLTLPSVWESLATNFSADTTLIILAAIKRQLGDAVDVFEANMRITHNICRAIERCPIQRIIFVSSAAVYGEDVQHDVITEETPLCPRTYYGLAKFNAEWLLREAVEAGGASSLCIIRPPTIYGPGDTSLSYGAPLFIDRILKNENIVLWGDGSELREFVFIDDAARAITAIAASDFEGVVNLASGLSYTFQDCLDFIRGAASGELSVESRPRSKEKVDHRFDNSCFRKILPHFDFTPLRDGVEELYKSAQIQRRNRNEAAAK